MKTISRDSRGSGFKWVDKKIGLYQTTIPKKGNKGTRVLFGSHRANHSTGVTCLECGVTLISLNSHIQNVHQISTINYKKKHSVLRITYLPYSLELGKRVGEIRYRKM